jgi:phage replication initiation protein
MLKDLNLVGGMTNTDWLNQFHDEMGTHKITQGQLAEGGHRMLPLVP